MNGYSRKPTSIPTNPNSQSPHKAQRIPTYPRETSHQSTPARAHGRTS